MEPKPKSPKEIAYEEKQLALEAYDKKVRGMSHRALVKELKRRSDNRYEGKGFTMNGASFDNPRTPNRAGEVNAWAAVLGIVLKSTIGAKILEYNKGGVPVRYARLDQINPQGRLHSYLL